MARTSYISVTVSYEECDAPSDQDLLDAYEELLQYVEEDERLTEGEYHVTLTLGDGAGE